MWERLGNVPVYTEPFFGSGAVLLGRPHEPGIETVNDIDGFVVNAYRAIQHSPGETAKWADNPVFENDLHARHIWLKERRVILTSQLEADPDYHDVKVAGWWLWGIAVWIGGGFCGDSGAGPWSVITDEQGNKRLIHTNCKGKGIKRQLVHLGDAGQGVMRKRVSLGRGGRGVERTTLGIEQWFEALSERLRRVRVCCGDWARICGPSPTFKLGLTGVFLDPPYGEDAGRDMDLYACDSGSIAKDVREWAIQNGNNPLMRIALCGYESEHVMPPSWDCVAWRTHGGYAHQGKNAEVNRNRERIWFSKYCLKSTTGQLFAIN